MLLFRKNTTVEFVNNTIQSNIDNIIRDMNLQIDNYDGIGSFIEIIREEGKFPYFEIINEGIFLSVFQKIMDKRIKVGSYDYYLELLPLIFGSEITIEFENNSTGVLDINISNFTGVLFDWIVGIEKDNIIDEDGDFIVFNETPFNLTTENFVKLVQDMTPISNKVNLNFI